MSGPNRVLRWMTVFTATLLVCVAGSAPVFVTGLVVSEAIIHPLTLFTMGLLASLTSSWMSNFLGGSPTRSRILRIAAVTETVAVLLVISRIRFSPNAVSLAAWGLVVSAGACIAASKFRSGVRNNRRDTIISLVLLAIIPAAVVSSVVIASLLGLTGS